MKKSAMFLLTACMGLATVSAPALAQNGGHMMGNDQGQGTMGNDHNMSGQDGQ